MNFRRRCSALIKELEKAGMPFVMLTSRSAESTIKELAGRLEPKLEKASVRVKAIANNWLGGQVSVSGLLAAKDILEQHNATGNEGLIVPSNIFNHDGITLDDVSQIEFRDLLGRPLLVVDQYFEDWEWI